MHNVSFNSMGKGERPPLLQAKPGPGPCTYTVPSKLGQEGMKPALHPRINREKRENIPGPGAYEPNFKATLERFPAIALSTGPRVEKDFSTKKDVPGPGQYKLNGTLEGLKFGFGSGRDHLPKPEALPGPGTYHVPCTFAKTANYQIPNKDNTFEYI